MALRHKLNKSQYDALSDELKKEYIADGDGYALDVVGLPEPEDTGPLKRANDRLKEEVRTLKEKNSTLQEQVDNAPNIETINAEHAKTNAKLTTFVEETLIDAKAMEVATAISTAPKLLANEIKGRLKVDMTGDKPKAVFVGKDGKTVDFDPKIVSQEFVANKDYAAIIKASAATGSGAPTTPTTPKGSGAPATGDTTKPTDFSKLSPADMAAHLKAKREAKEEAGQQ